MALDDGVSTDGIGNGGVLLRNNLEQPVRAKQQEWQFALGLLNTMFQTKWRSTLLLIAAISAGESTRVAIRFGLARHVDQSQAEFDIITDCSSRECETDQSGNSHWA